MHLLRYNRSHSRRLFLDRLARGVVAAGVLAPLGKVLADAGDSAAAYPDELRSLEEYTRGRIGSGDVIDAGNVEQVRELLDSVRYRQIAKLGRRLRVRRSTTDLMQLGPRDYLQASLRNQGLARFDQRGNVVTRDGQPWIGGNPFPQPNSGLEYFAGLTMNWGRHDAAFYAIRETDLSPQGAAQFQYESGWAEFATVGRIRLQPRPSLPGQEDKLRYQSVFYVRPDDVRGTSFLNIWAYDQQTMPELYGYLPAFKRIRSYPTSQRFEPLIAGSTLYLSDAWAAGDPLHTWGNYRITGRGPFLAAVAGGWNGAHPNWEHAVHGGPQGLSFFDTEVELVPEAVVVEAEPLRFPRAPISRKQVWFDARTCLPIGMVTYDRRGEPFHSFDAAFGVYRDGRREVVDGPQPYWSWTHVHVFDVQSGRMTRLEQVRAVADGHQTSVNDPDLYDKYLTKTALMRLGKA